MSEKTEPMLPTPLFNDAFWECDGIVAKIAYGSYKRNRRQWVRNDWLPELERRFQEGLAKMAAQARTEHDVTQVKHMQQRADDAHHTAITPSVRCMHRILRCERGEGLELKFALGQHDDSKQSCTTIVLTASDDMLADHYFHTVNSALGMWGVGNVAVSWTTFDGPHLVIRSLRPHLPTENFAKEKTT